MSDRVYKLRQAILKAVKQIQGSFIGVNLNEISHYPASMIEILNPSREEMVTEWGNLLTMKYLEQVHYGHCRLTTKGLRQLAPEFSRDAFIHGPRFADSIEPDEGLPLESVLREKIDVLKERLKLADERTQAAYGVIKERNRQLNEARMEINRLKKEIGDRSI